MHPLALALPVFALHAILALADEALFHRRREVPRWERIGHPLDTFVVLIPLALTVFLPARAPWIGLFWGMAVVSSLFVTKDEWVHARLCLPAEQWLHAVLFLLHPVAFFAAWVLWKAGETPWLAAQCLLVAGSMIYQTVYWNFWRGSRSNSHPPTGSG